MRGFPLAGKITYFAASSLFVVAFPIFSRHHDQRLSSGKWILAAGGVVGATAGVVVVLFTLEPAWVVIPLLGGRYRAAEGYVPWMAAIFGLYALGFLVAIYLLARKRRGIIGVLAARSFCSSSASSSSIRHHPDYGRPGGRFRGDGRRGALLVLLGGQGEDSTSSSNALALAERSGELAVTAAVVRPGR